MLTSRDRDGTPSGSETITSRLLLLGDQDSDLHTEKSPTRQKAPGQTSQGPIQIPGLRGPGGPNVRQDVGPGGGLQSGSKLTSIRPNPVPPDG